MNGPTDSARRLYSRVWESVLLYAAPIWASALGMARDREDRDQRPESGAGEDVDSVEDSVARGIVRGNGRYAHTH